MKSIPDKHPNEDSSTGTPCSLWRRLLIMLYDAFAVFALLILATSLAMLAGFENLAAGRDPLFTLYLLAVWFIYLGWCWTHGGMTVGMRAWKVVIRHDGGGLPGWGRCLLRFVVSWLSALAAGLGFLWALFEPGKRTWHDLASQTRLLRR